MHLGDVPTSSAGRDFRPPQQKACAICRGADRLDEYLRVYGSRTHRSEVILRCGGCGLVYVDEPIRLNKPLEHGDGVSLLEAWNRQFPDTLDVYDARSWGTRFQDTEDVIGWQFAAVADLLGGKLDEPGCTIVEIGAARGYLMARIAELYPGARLIAIEPSPVMAKMAEKSGARVINGIVESAGLEPLSVDAVVGFGSFIQIRDPLSALLCLNRALKMGGRILLDSPDNDSIFRWLVRFLQKVPTLSRWPGVGTAVEAATRRIYNPGRFYYYTAKTYRKLLAMAGFEVTETHYRHARHVSSGKEKLPLAVKLAMNSVSFAEKVFNKQSWVEVRGVKIRELESA